MDSTREEDRETGAASEKKEWQRVDNYTPLDRQPLKSSEEGWNMRSFTSLAAGF